MAMARPRPPVYQPNYDDSQDYDGYNNNNQYNSNKGYKGNNKNPYGNYVNNRPNKHGQQGYPPNPNQATNFSMIVKINTWCRFPQRLMRNFCARRSQKHKKDSLEQCFSTFFGSRHPVRLKKKLAAPLPWLK